MSYSSKSYLDTLGSISLLNSIQVAAPQSSTAATTLDVNNTDLSVSVMLNMLESFNTNQLNSCDVATLLAPIISDPKFTMTNSSGLTAIYNIISSINLSLTDLAKLTGTIIASDLSKPFIIPSITVPSSFQNIALFSTPLSSSIQKSDIKYYLSTSSNFLGGNTPSLSDKSFQKINSLVNEIYEMKPELIVYNQKSNNFPIFTFTELLGDTDEKNTYLCSIRVIFYSTSLYNSVDQTFPNALYFVISHMNVNSMISLNSFNNVLDQISSTKRLMNFSVLVLKKLNNTVPFDVNTKTFIDYITNSKFKSRFGGSGIYIFLYKLSSHTYKNVLNPYDDSQSYDTVLLHEQSPEWVGADSKNLFALGNDLIVSQATYNIYKNLLNHFEFRKDMQFGANYKWNYGQKHSSCMLFGDSSNLTYMFGCGVNLETFIPNSIQSTGDTLLSGDLNIKDIKGNSIFQISNSEKKVTSAYKVGVGKDQPQTTMDIEDTSMASILNVIEQFSTIAQLVNTNIGLLINADLSAKTFSQVVQQFINPSIDPNTLLIQTPFYYVSIYELNSNYTVADQTVQYNWLFGTNPPTKIWDLTNPKKVSSLPVSNQKQFLTSYMTTLFQKTFVDNNTDVMSAVTVDWLYGKKHAFNKFFVNTKNGKKYWIGSGVDLQQYNLRYNTNDNIERLFNCINTYQSLLQVIIKSNFIPVDSNTGIPSTNYIQPLEALKTNIAMYGNPTAIRKYVISSSTVKVQYALNVNYTQQTSTLKEMATLFNNPLNYSSLLDINDSNNDSNLTIMYQSIIEKIKNCPAGQDGIVWFEDSKEYYASVFYCTNDSSNVKTIISIEIRLDTFIIPTLTVKGDTRVNGELSTRILNQPSNFTTIDPDRNFIGFGTDERHLYYSYPTPNTKSPFFYVSNSNTDINNYNYPCAVFDRSDVNDSSPISTIVNVKRTLTKISPLGAGLDIGFEVTKSNSQTQRLGSIGMSIEDDYNCGFFVNKFNILNNTDSNLMYISNAGQLSVKSICLTGDTPQSSINDDGTLTINLGTSMFGSQTVDLPINNTNIVYNIDYNNSGLENGTYTIKINLNGKTINHANTLNIFNATTNTNNSAAVLLIKVNTFKNGNIMQYFTNMTYYAA
jgi:hypothetical protein